MKWTFPLWAHRILIWRLVRREVESRFKGSFLGLFWAVIAPLAMLAVYSFVFGSIFGARWSKPDSIAVTEEFGFPMMLFLGLILFGFFSESANRAPTLILENVSYVKKVVFPLEALPIINVISALITSGLSFIVFLFVYLILYGLPPYTIFLLPISILPLILFTLGTVYILSSVGVFLRDLKHVVPLATTAMLFLSSVFYDPSALPDKYRIWLYLNPLTPAVNHARDLAFWGDIPNILLWSLSLAVSSAVYIAGAIWFDRTKKAFADVI